MVGMRVVYTIHMAGHIRYIWVGGDDTVVGKENIDIDMGGR